MGSWGLGVSGFRVQGSKALGLWVIGLQGLRVQGRVQCLGTAKEFQSQEFEAYRCCGLCVHTYIYVCVCVYIYTCVYIIYIHIHTCVYMCMCIQTDRQIDKVGRQTDRQVQKYIYIFIKRQYVYTDMYLCISMCIYIYVCIHTYIYT